MRLPAWPPGAALLCSSSMITGMSCKKAAVRMIDFGVSSNVWKYEFGPAVGLPQTLPAAFSVGVLPLRERPHRYTMNGCTPSTATSTEANEAAITHLNGIDSAPAAAMAAAHSASVPAGAANCSATPTPSSVGSKRTSPSAS